MWLTFCVFISEILVARNGISDPKNSRFADNLPHFEEEMKEQKLKVPKSEKDLPPIKYKSQKGKEKSTKKAKKEL